ncbi:hypothetical protein GE21DRAFT_2826 [Neurospora crassa]|uniref:Uncharacterized protein n=2 Tax=Neurospora crassa TaxID=5141 RepID=Q1K5C0_NEUCR|nr:hypothetical protein NCU03429 [Neurospora crassa OR74A]EAA27479.3 hypothetical protein NCU03429 [Neurospora crassa OR74A]KHE86375.1 hypothetical protein GE21DRAFT_2826 [Neurospora crassa]CAD21036.1 hypothetical protein [Neurospora crassa]|eukprot:XP_956715.3 hypothetical protein NCU03429 [Neurospora crassa OR74A]
MGREGPGEGCLGALVPGAVGQEGVLGQKEAQERGYGQKGDGRCRRRPTPERQMTYVPSFDSVRCPSKLSVSQEWKSSNKFGDCVVTTPQQDVCHSDTASYTTTTWLRNMTIPASQPHFDSHTATLFLEALWPVARHTFFACPSTLGLDIDRECRGLRNHRSPDLQPFRAAEHHDSRTARLCGLAITCHQPLIGAGIDGFDPSKHDRDKNQYSLWSVYLGYREVNGIVQYADAPARPRAFKTV